jgi:NAD+ kinase
MRFALLVADSLDAARAAAAVRAQHTDVDSTDAEVLVVLGGDGFMLEMIHKYHNHPAPLYGMNRGSVGFLLNDFVVAGLPERLARAQRVELFPLSARIEHVDGTVSEALAFNEVSLLRETRQAAKLRVSVDGIVRMEELVCDGALLATPAGSTAYNLSVHGAILPLGCDLLALTPVAPFRPRRWRGALIPHAAEVCFDILDPDKRPVAAVADFTECRDVVRVRVREERERPKALLFDPEKTLAERIVKEQFLS